ncbi:alpha/beta fold hydrolase [Aquicella siphonis]|nr:alpha/beta hydrolase [Aquicella siphonis]
MMMKNRDGINLSYKIAGNGTLNFVLVHNAGGSRQFMNDQLEYLSCTARVLNVDLRGHGESDKPEQNYTVEGFAEDIVYLCQAHDIKKAVFVGLNYGVNVAIELANISSLVSHLVLIDPPVLMEPWVIQLVQEHIDDLNKPAHENFAETLAEAVFLNITPDKKQVAINAFETTAKTALASTYENLLAWDKESVRKLQSCTMPVLYIQSGEPFCTEDALRTHCPHLMAGKVVGSGHWATLEVPDQVNSMIKRFLDITENKSNA